LAFASLVDWKLSMSTCADLTAVLESLAEQLSGTSASSCGCGSGGAGGTDAPQSTTDTGDIFNPTGPPPDGFATWEEYQDYKCDVATWIVDQALADVQWLQTVNLVGLAAAGLAGGLLTPIPGDEIVALVAFLGATLVALSYETVVLQEWEDTLQDARDDLICALYSSNDSSAAQANYTDVRNTEIDTQTADPVAQQLIRLLADFWQPNGNFNKLFEKDEYLNLTGITGDCSGCVECAEYFVLRGINTGGFNWDAEFEPANSLYYVDFFVNNEDATYTGECGPEQTIEISNLVGWTDPGPGSNFFIGDSDGNTVYTSQNVQWSGAVCGRYFQIRSNTDFTVTLTKGDCP
jgi:hypothetical protein